MATGWPDVSVWQGAVDWGAVRADLEASGLPLVAITKATEGWGFTDSTFARNWPEMKRVGLRRGAYGFARPDLGSRAKDEADWLHSVARPEGDDFLICDAEAGSGNLLWWACEYMDELNALTRGQQGMYSGWWWMGPRNVYGPEIGRRCWLHLAAYQSAAPTPPPGWSSVAIQQFTSSGRLAGVAGDVDLNRTLAFPAQERAMTLDELKQAVREVLNEGTAFGFTGWATTEQGEIDLERTIFNIVAGLDPDRDLAKRVATELVKQGATVNVQADPTAIAAALAQSAPFLAAVANAVATVSGQRLQKQ